MENQYLNLRHLFTAYARKLAAQDGFPAIRDYAERRYRIISGLFEIELAVMGHDMFEFAECYNRAAFYNPCGGVVLGSSGLGCLEGFPSAIGRLRRHAASMRHIYSGLAVEWITRNHPGADQRRIHVQRLAELGLPATPPDEEECIKFMERDEEAPVDDDVSPWMLDGLKRREEDFERARRRTEVEKAAVIASALAAGIGTAGTVSQIIYEMGVEEFLKLAEGFPGLSRVDFKKSRP